jgi:serine/threonine protein kinase
MDSCVFKGICSDIFTDVAMRHLCAPNPEQSFPRKQLQHMLDEHQFELNFLNRINSPTEYLGNISGVSYDSSIQGQGSETEPQGSPSTGSPLLQTLEETERILIQKIMATLKAKEGENSILQRKIKSLQESLVAATESRKPIQSDSPNTPSKTAAASLIQNGVQIISASLIDLDFSSDTKVLLGRGVYSDVYESTMTVAVKVITGRFNQQRLQHFRKEAEALQLVQGSPGVIRFHGICIDSFPNLYLITEVAGGGSLEELLACDEDLPFARATAIAANTAAAMDHVHGRGLVHRDLKPSNVMLTRHGDAVKLIDFGLAARLEPGEAIEPASDGAGTPVYQAPEVLLRRPFGLPADAFSFGVVLWEMAARRAPFADLSLEEMTAAVVSGERPPVDPAWNRVWAEVMEQCWQRDPLARPLFSQAAPPYPYYTSQRAFSWWSRLHCPPSFRNPPPRSYPIRFQLPHSNPISHLYFIPFNPPRQNFAPSEGVPPWPPCRYTTASANCSRRRTALGPRRVRTAAGTARARRAGCGPRRRGGAGGRTTAGAGCSGAGATLGCRGPRSCEPASARRP